MSPNEPMTTLKGTENRTRYNAVRTASGLTLLAAIWLFVSPWVYGAAPIPNAWNAWIVGAVMILLACIPLGNPASMPGLSWFNACLAVWTFFSPWIYGFTTDRGRFINSLCVGVVVFVLAIISAKSTARTDVEQRPVRHGV